MMVPWIIAGFCIAALVYSVVLIKKVVFERNHWRYKHDCYVKDVEQLKIDLRHEQKERLQSFEQNLDASNVHFLSQACVGESARSLRSKVQDDIVLKQYNRMTQELLGGIVDEAEGLSRELQISLCERIWDSIQQFKEKYADSPYIMPHGCRVAYTKGCRTVIVIEQEPQVRTVGVTPSLVGERSRKLSVSQSRSSYRFNLAFPYVYFILAFDDGKYTYHELYFRNSPFTSVREHVYLAPIPNVFRGQERWKSQKDKMCMGVGFANEVRGELTIARQAEHVVTDFWLRSFNEHLGTGGFEKIDKRMNGWAKWQESTQEDPLFILNVQWKKGKTMKGVIDAMLEARERKHKNDGIDNNLRKILDSGVEKVTTRLKEEISYAQTNHALHPDKIEDMIRDLLEEIVCEHTKKVFHHCTKEG